MKRLTYVFLKVNAFYTYAAVFISFRFNNAVFADKVLVAAFCSARLFVFREASERKVNITVCTKRNIILSNLIAFCKVRIKIVLAVKFCKARNLAVQSLSCNSTKFYITFRNTRHCSRKSQTNRTNTCIRHSAVSIFAGTESLCFC